MKTIKNEILWFIVPTFTLTYGLGIVAYLMGGLDHFPLMATSMYIPALVVLGLYKFKINKPIFKGNDLGLNFRGKRYWLIAIVSIFTLIALSFLISWLFKPGFFNAPDQVLAATEKTGISVGHWGLDLILIIGINTLLAPFINILMFLGEEIGWRAYLFPRLLKLFDPRLSFIIGGTIWGLWHSAGILLGHNYPNNPVMGNLMMILLCIPLGVIFQYLYFKSGNIFTAAIAHGVVNWTAMNFIMFLVADPGYSKMIYGPTGIIGIALLWLTAWVLAGKSTWVDDNPLQQKVAKVTY